MRSIRLPTTAHVSAGPRSGVTWRRRSKDEPPPLRSPFRTFLATYGFELTLLGGSIPVGLILRELLG